MTDKANTNTEKTAEKKDAVAVAKTPTKADKASSSTPKPSKPKTPTTQKTKSSGSGFTAFLFLLIIVMMVVLGVGAYLGWQFWQTQNARVANIESNVVQQATDFSKIIHRQATQLEEQSQVVAQLSSSSENDQKAFEQRLNAQATRLNQLSGDSREGWMLEEARYLLRLANQRQLTGGSVVGMMGLLESADSLLLAIDKPDVFPLRESLRKDILRLQISPVIDREGIYLQLLALINQVEQLPVVPLTMEKKSEQPETLDLVKETDTLWYKNLWGSVKNTFTNLDQYVRIKHHDEPQKLLASDAEQQLRAQSLRMMFEQAQIALLREEAVIFQQSLQQARSWLHKHYGHYAEKQALVNAIEKLQQQKITAQLPDLSNSLVQMNNYIQRAQTSIVLPKVDEAISEKKSPENNTTKSGQETAL